MEAKNGSKGKQKYIFRRVFDMNQWQGKKWYCYGTSMTSNTSIIKATGMVSGTYSKYLAQYAGLEEHNFGKGGSGIIPQFHGDDNTKTRCMRLTDGKAEADLITVEVIPNDMKGELGEVTDLCDDTFCGNLNQIIAYLLANTKATVVILIASRSRYRHDDASVKTLPVSKGTKAWLAWEDAHGIQCWNGASEAGLGYYRVAKDNTLVQDQIHLTDKGGEVLAKYFWGKLKNIYPDE